MKHKIVNFDYTFHDNKFKVKFKPISRPIESWYNEISNTAKYIFGSTDKPIYIGMSGGIDGEAVARIFMENNLPFSAISLRYAGGENDHDIEYAIRFCKKYSINHYIFEVDYHELYGPIMERFIADGYYATNIYRYLQLYILEKVDQLGGTAVLAAGEQVYYKDANDILYLGVSSELMLSLDYCEKNNTLHYVNFFLTTPEMTAAYMKIKIINQLLSTPRLCSNSLGKISQYPEPRGASAKEKKIVYQTTWTDMEPRPKFSGFEKIRDFRHALQNTLVEKYPYITADYVAIDTIKQQLGI